MRKVSAWGALAAAAFLLAGCTARFESFPFITSDGKRIEIRESPGRSRDTEAVFAPARARASSPLYSLRPSLVVADPRLAFAISYTSTLPGVRLTVYSEKNKTLRTAILPESAETPLRFLVPLSAGDRIWGFQLSAAEPVPGQSLLMRGAGITRAVHGFLISQDGLTVDGSVSVLEASAAGASARIGQAARQEMARGTWVIHLDLAEPAGEQGSGGSLRFAEADGTSSSFLIDGSAGVTSLDFARGSMPFLPRDIRAAAALRGMDISLLPPDRPVPADPGMILTWDRSQWRRTDFEVYSWDRFPRVLIFDTASYDIQDDLFKRLAYFVEKAGFRDTIEDPAALEGKHGYNAHDYRAEDLARFFSAASQRGVPLTAGEKQLEEILVFNDILRPDSSGYGPGEGAVISISRSSDPVLRQLLLTHECAHGVFFSLPAFRDATEAVWEALSPVEKDVWLDFLSSRNYDVNDHYLVVNEFQAYLFQQERIAVESFQNVTLARMRARGGAKAALAAQLLSQRPHSFLDAFDALDARLRQAGGPPGSRVLAVRAEK